MNRLLGHPLATVFAGNMCFEVVYVESNALKGYVPFVSSLRRTGKSHVFPRKLFQCKKAYFFIINTNCLPLGNLLKSLPFSIILLVFLFWYTTKCPILKQFLWFPDCLISRIRDDTFMIYKS